MISKVKNTAFLGMCAFLLAATAGQANEPTAPQGQVKVLGTPTNQSLNAGLDEKWSSDDIVALDEDVPAVAASFMTQTFPRLEVRTASDCVKVIAELPGVEPRDLELVANSDILCLAGKRQAPGSGRVIVSELPSGAFKRRVRLPHPVKVEQSVACLKDGILTVTMPRWKNAESPQKISISTNERGYQTCASQNYNRF